MSDSSSASAAAAGAGSQPVSAWGRGFTPFANAAPGSNHVSSNTSNAGMSANGASWRGVVTGSSSSQPQAVASQPQSQPQQQQQRWSNAPSTLPSKVDDSTSGSNSTTWRAAGKPTDDQTAGHTQQAQSQQSHHAASHSPSQSAHSQPPTSKLSAPGSSLYQASDFGPASHRGVKWFYLDPQNNTQGPFTSDDMRTWYENRYFDLKLPVQCMPDGEQPPPALKFIPLGVWFLHHNKAFLPTLPDLVEQSPDASNAPVGGDVKPDRNLISPVDESSSYAASVHQLVADDDDNLQDVTELERYNSNTQPSAQQQNGLNPTAQSWSQQRPNANAPAWQPQSQQQQQPRAPNGVSSAGGQWANQPAATSRAPLSATSQPQQPQPTQPSTQQVTSPNGPPAGTSPSLLSQQQQQQQQMASIQTQLRLLQNHLQNANAQYQQLHPVSIQQFLQSLQLQPQQLQALTPMQTNQLQINWSSLNQQRAQQQQILEGQMRQILTAQQQLQQQLFLLQKMQAQQQQQQQHFSQPQSQPQSSRPFGANDAGVDAFGRLQQQAQSFGQQPSAYGQQQQPQPQQATRPYGQDLSKPTPNWNGQPQQFGFDSQQQQPLRDQFGGMSLGQSLQSQQQQQQLSYDQQLQLQFLNQQLLSPPPHNAPMTALHADPYAMPNDYAQPQQQQQPPSLQQQQQQQQAPMQQPTQSQQQQQQQPPPQQHAAAAATTQEASIESAPAATTQSEESTATTTTTDTAAAESSDKSIEDEATAATTDNGATTATTSEQAEESTSTSTAAPAASTETAPTPSIAPWAAKATVAPPVKTLAEIQAEEAAATQKKQESHAAAAAAAARRLPFNTTWGGQSVPLSLTPDAESTATVIHVNGGSNALLPTPPATTPSIKLLTGIQTLPASYTGASTIGAASKRGSKSGRRTEAAIVQSDATSTPSNDSPVASPNAWGTKPATVTATTTAAPKTDAAPVPVVNAWATKRTPGGITAPSASMTSTAAATTSAATAPLLTIRPKSMQSLDGTIAPTKPYNTVRLIDPQIVELPASQQQQQQTTRKASLRGGERSSRTTAPKKTTASSNAGGEPTMSPDFSSWCAEHFSALAGSSGYDSSLPQFLMAVESDEEAREYIHQAFESHASSAAIDELADEFLQLKSFETSATKIEAKSEEDGGKSRRKARR